MTHLGQRLSALIDGELEGSERERVLLHMTRCDSCRAEAAALRTLKRRMSALGDAAAGAGLTGRLIRLSALASMADKDPADAELPDDEPPPASPWRDRPNDLHGRGQASAEQRLGRYFLAGSLAVFLAGLGTAAVIAGGEPQPQAPTPPVTPSVDVMVFPPGPGTDTGTVLPVARPSSLRPRPAFSVAHSAHTRT
ncbi:MAG: zf-HC2 domain-containing protein [Streptosporangiaceae bacterium]